MERTERSDNLHGNGEGVTGGWRVLELSPVDGSEYPPSAVFPGRGDPPQLGNGFHK